MESCISRAHEGVNHESLTKGKTFCVAFFGAVIPVNDSYLSEPLGTASTLTSLLS